MGIACFSERDDSILMWSHYANKHKGFCAEYGLMDFTSQIGFTAIPVIYSNCKACMKTINMEKTEEDTRRLLIYSLSQKSVDWSYEREWRIVRSSGACGTLWDYEKKVFFYI